MTAPSYGDCPAARCGKRVQLDARGNLRPHQVPIENRDDPKRSQRCPERTPKVNHP